MSLAYLKKEGEDRHDDKGDGTKPPPKLRRFHGAVKVGPLRVERDAGRIAEEIVQHLTGLVGAEVEVVLDIHARLPEGSSEKLVRDVTENCRTLKFDSCGFEET